ncbi:TetR/AcrR family transcriptional regulator [Cohnella panacarvi]|uniref:TetR/AcrR family transcriptional regulator n=1 Tax=Cohnella panacarvi TaxID=400776 RepID=UPI00047B5656|nr:TetR/AcrR family transcriptional regulator [Cohnella panacarvi]
MARNREFDENVVLQKAMELFWEQGYEKTSINDLVERMGVHRRSLYDTFGDKHALFMMAIDRYESATKSNLESLVSRSKSAKQAIRFIFDYMIEGSEDGPTGCLFVNSAVELASRDSEVDAKACESFKFTEELLAELIRKGQHNGEFQSKEFAEVLAASLHNTLLGIRVLVQTSVGKDKLNLIANFSMSLLDK